jgi:hypothetical protein
MLSSIMTPIKEALFVRLGDPGNSLFLTLVHVQSVCIHGRVRRRLIANISDTRVHKDLTSLSIRHFESGGPS